MDRLIITQRIKMIKIYYESGALRRDYNLHNRPNTQAIGKIAMKFEETGVAANIKRPVHHRFALFTKNIAIVSESVAEEPNVSIPHCSQEL